MKLLHLDTSILGNASASRQLSRAVVDTWRQAEPALDVAYRDLASDSAIVHLSPDNLATVGQQAYGQSDDAQDQGVLEDFIAADALVISAPMYNFTIPTQLKAWIDRIAVAGTTFRYTADGPEGLAGGKKVVIVATAGGLHADQPTGAAHVPYLVGVLNFLGITDIEVIRAEGLGLGDEARDKALADAREHIQALFETA